MTEGVHKLPMIRRTTQLSGCDTKVGRWVGGWVNGLVDGLIQSEYVKGPWLRFISM